MNNKKIAITSYILLCSLPSLGMNKNLEGTCEFYKNKNKNQRFVFEGYSNKINQKNFETDYINAKWIKINEKTGEIISVINSYDEMFAANESGVGFVFKNTNAYLKISGLDMEVPNGTLVTEGKTYDMLCQIDQL